MNRVMVGVILTILAVAIATVFATRRTSDECGSRSGISIQGERAEIIDTPDGSSVVVTADEGFRVAALVWVLRIGDLEFDRSRYPDSTENTLEFPIPEGAISQLQDGDSVSVRYGNPVVSQIDGYAFADQAANDAAGFATIRIPEACRP